MKEALKTAMMTSISEVLETMFFMTIDLNPEASATVFFAEADESLFVSRIGFVGKVTGFFLLIIPDSILRTMTETFMSLETAEVTETHMNGTVLETINMVAGNTFSNLDNQAVFNLDIPELVDAKTASAVCPEKFAETDFLNVETFAGIIGLRVCFVYE